MADRAPDARSGGRRLTGRTPPVKDFRVSPKLLATLIAAALVLSALPSLSGCSTGESALRVAIDVIRGDRYALSEEGERELARFDAAYDRYVIDPDQDRQFRHFSDAFKRVRVRYVRPVTDAALIDAALAGVETLKAEPASVEPAVLVEAALDSMLASLDPHSSYLNPEELAETNVATKGEFGGLGIEVTMEDGLIKVISPIEDTPASRAGIEPGDWITHTDGEPIKGLTLMQAVKRMRGKPGTSIRLTVRRADKSPFDVSIRRAVIKVRSVRWRIEDDIAYIRVVSFTERMEPGIEKAFDEVDRKLGSRLKGVVLDLRNNPGGLLEQSLILADAFLDDGEIVSVRGRRARAIRTFSAHAGDMAERVPVVVLINGGSASASEIVAGALQDQGRAVVMGRRSYGKGSVQTITPLPVEGALRLTTQLYYTPSGRAIQAVGVVPSITLVREEDAGAGRREADLPGALPAQAEAEDGGAKVATGACPAVGEREDRELGCAIAYLKSGSTDRFLASVGQRPSM
jgi:carboxyl-terminal processing protease